MKTIQLGLAASAALLLLAACGGGDGDAGGPPPVVTSSSTSAARYSDTMLVTLNGSNLNAPAMTVSSAGCSNMTRSTTAPNVSSATTAYYTCRVSGVGNLSVAVAINGGGTIATVPFTIAQPQVTMQVTNGGAATGSLVLTLRPEAAPITVDNFLAYVKAGFYNDTVIHRHATNFVLQGGAFAYPLQVGRTPIPSEKPPLFANIALEVGRGLFNTKYSIAMARGNELNSANSQFFFNLANNTGLDAGYAVFGSVTGNTALVDAMQAATCTLWPEFNRIPTGDCVPNPNIRFTSVTQTQ